MREELILNLQAKKYWFDTYYTIHEQKYRRLIVMNIDKEQNEQLLQDLYIQAENVRAEIQALEAQLFDNSSEND